MTRYSKTMNESLAEVRKVTPEEIAEASARRDAMRHGAGGRRGIDPADRDDMKATDKDQELAKKNMVMQLPLRHLCQQGRFLFYHQHRDALHPYEQMLQSFLRHHL